MSNLFRPESLQARSSAWLGSVRLTQPVSYWVLAWVGMAVAAAIGSFAAFGTYTKKATVPGVLLPLHGSLRLINLGGPGIIDEIRVREGSVVKAGEVLFTIRAEQTSELGATRALIDQALQRRARLLELEGGLSQQRLHERIAAWQQRMTALETEIAGFERDIQLHKAREKLVAAGLVRLEKLVDTGFMSPAQLDGKREEVLALQAQQQQILRSQAALEREKQALVQQIAEARLQARIEAAELAKAQTGLHAEIAENSVRAKHVVLAPQSGIVSGLAVHVGQGVVAGQLLATLLPGDSASSTVAESVTPTLMAHFYATTRQAGFLHAGQPVRVRYAAYPYQKFGMGEGEVVEISRSPYAIQELPTHIAAMLQHLGPAGDAVYRVTVRIKDATIKAYGETHALKPGMLAEADIVQDTRKLWEWALEPVFSVSKKQM